MKELVSFLASLPLLTGPGTPYFAGMPPHRFQTLAAVRVKIVAEADIYTACDAEPVDGLKLFACTRTDWLGRPYVVMPDTCPRGEVDQTARIFCHEVAHAAGGWTRLHEQ